MRCCSTDLFDILMFRLVEYCLHHLVTNPNSLWEARGEELLNFLKPILVRGEIPEGDAVGPSPCCKSELKVVGSKGIVLDGRIDYLLQQYRFPEEILCYAKPQAKQLMQGMSVAAPQLLIGPRPYRCGTYHVVVWNDAHLPPAVHHS